ncbi:MAG: DNA-binding protein WhiA [Clostridia bacterium]|nr:DNA-binding protein WhiA [Clostridia bacterium]
MSFSTEQKNEIADQPFTKACCRRAELSGILTTKGSLLDGGGICLTLDRGVATEHAARLIKEVSAKEPEISPLPKGGRGSLVRAYSPALSRELGAFFAGGEFFHEKCAQCRTAFFRGVFLASGRMTDPSKQYRLEFHVKCDIARFTEMLEENGLSPLVSEKPKETLVYFRNSGYIEDFFALAGMNSTIFALMNSKIQGEIRNNVNRVANCETSNINKAVSASAQQISLIQELIDRDLISQLPDELKKTALLRLEHSDLSLSQLAAMITPSITKPGLSHRLRRITELAKELVERNKKRI